MIVGDSSAGYNEDDLRDEAFFPKHHAIYVRERTLMMLTSGKTFCMQRRKRQLPKNTNLAPLFRHCFC